MVLITVFFIMQILVNYVFRPYLSWGDAERNYLIEFINDCDTAELENLNIGNNVDDPTRDDIIQITHKNWD